MSEEAESEEVDGPRDSGSAVWAALGAASREKADRFLDEQTSFVQLQKEHLHEQRHLLLSRLRWRRFDDQMKGALQIMLVALGALVVIAVIATVWDATQADGLVIDEFSVPPAFGQAGVSGTVLTEDFTARLSDIREFANKNSYSRSKEVTARKDDLRIEIPEVGISIAEAQHFLRDWLGHERHISGNLRNVGNGKIALTVNISGASPVSVTGSDLKAVEDDAAEKTFGVLDPVNIVNYLSARDRLDDALAAARHFVPLAETPALKSDSYALWCYTTAFATGDLPLAIRRCRIGISLDPALAAPHTQLGKFLYISGQDEEALAEARTILTLKDADQLPAHQGGGFDLMRTQAAAWISELLGDYANATTRVCGHFCTYAETLLSRAENAARQHDVTGSWNLEAEAMAAGNVDASVDSEVHYFAHAARGDWQAAAADMTTAIGSYSETYAGVGSRYAHVYATARFVPLLAIAEAHLGEFAQAHRAINATADYCYDCLRARAAIAENESRPDAAAYWYARAVEAAPSIPFAYSDWGAMLMREGHHDAAIAKFKVANEKGPHFADPLEMWGEALMLKNRADLALDKFEEANKYAPRWGRLHLKWGEALFYAGRKDEAKKELAIAAGLDLPAADKSDLESWMKMHG